MRSRASAQRPGLCIAVHGSAADGGVQVGLARDVASARHADGLRRGQDGVGKQQTSGELKDEVTSPVAPPSLDSMPWSKRVSRIVMDAVVNAQEGRRSWGRVEN